VASRQNLLRQLERERGGKRKKAFPARGRRARISILRATYPLARKRKKEKRDSFPIIGRAKRRKNGATRSVKDIAKKDC